MAWSISGEGDSEAVYLVRGPVLSLMFVKPNKRDKLDRAERPNEPDPHHAPRNALQSRFAVESLRTNQLLIAQDK
jgi:hypothetical protein